MWEINIFLNHKTGLKMRLVNKKNINVYSNHNSNHRKQNRIISIIDVDVFQNPEYKNTSE